MASQSEVADYRNALATLNGRAQSDLAAALASLEGQPPVTVRDTLIEVFPELIGPYVTASGELAATWYEDLRRQALSTPYYATASGEVNTSRVGSLIRWGVKPLFGQSDSTVLSLIGGGVQRLIADASRDTIDLNAKKDVASVSWARVARPGACDWCLMLAGRGSVYRSKAAAGMVIGRGVDPSKAINADGSRKVGGMGGGIQARGARRLDSKGFHDDCHCTSVPTFYTIEGTGSGRYLAIIGD